MWICCGMQVPAPCPLLSVSSPAHQPLPMSLHPQPPRSSLHPAKPLLCPPLLSCMPSTGTALPPLTRAHAETRSVMATPASATARLEAQMTAARSAPPDSRIRACTSNTAFGNVSKRMALPSAVSSEVVMSFSSGNCPNRPRWGVAKLASRTSHASCPCSLYSPRCSRWCGPYTPTMTFVEPNSTYPEPAARLTDPVWKTTQAILCYFFGGGRGVGKTMHVAWHE